MVWCNKCGQEIFFDKTVRSASGKMIPLDPDREKHNHDPNDPNEPLKKNWTRNPNFVKPSSSSSFQNQNTKSTTSQQYESSNNFRIQKGQFEQRGGESEYRRPIDDLLNQHYNAFIQAHNNLNNKIDFVLQRINDEAEKSKELWRIIDATAAKVGVYKVHTAKEEYENRVNVNDHDEDLDEKIPDDEEEKLIAEDEEAIL